MLTDVDFHKKNKSESKINIFNQQNNNQNIQQQNNNQDIQQNINTDGSRKSIKF